MLVQLYICMYVYTIIYLQCTTVNFIDIYIRVIDVDISCIALLYVTHSKRKIEEHLMDMTWKINYSDVIFTSSGSRRMVNGNSLSCNVVTMRIINIMCWSY